MLYGNPNNFSIVIFIVFEVISASLRIKERSKKKGLTN